jgi:hypothetical protein
MSCEVSPCACWAAVVAAVVAALAPNKDMPTRGVGVVGVVLGEGRGGGGGGGGCGGYYEACWCMWRSDTESRDASLHQYAPACSAKPLMMSIGISARAKATLWRAASMYGWRHDKLSPARLMGATSEPQALTNSGATMPNRSPSLLPPKHPLPSDYKDT